MKVALIFLMIFVAHSRQQYRQRMMGPWLLPIPLPTENQPTLNDDRYFNQLNKLKEEPRQEPTSRDQYITKEQSFPDYQSRNKGFGFRQRPSFVNQQNARFFNFGSPSRTKVALLRTSTVSITSTCTSFTLVTCIPRALLLPAPVPAAPAPPNICGRKREIDSIDLFNDSQFLVTPSQVQSVEPTTIQQLEPAVSRNSQQLPIDIVSSKEEPLIDGPNQDLPVKKLLRYGRFYNLLRDVTIVTTVTAWSTTLSTRTSTFLPIVTGTYQAQPCLPARFRVC